jgi:hypothetical protein
MVGFTAIWWLSCLIVYPILGMAFSNFLLSTNGTNGTVLPFSFIVICGFNGAFASLMTVWKGKISFANLGIIAIAPVFIALSSKPLAPLVIVLGMWCMSVALHIVESLLYPKESDDANADNPV